MRKETGKIALFGLLTALALILGLLDRAVPASALLGGFIPGIKLGLANTVLLYAVYLMDWKSCVLLMLTKVVLSGLIFGSLNAILYSLAGGTLSLTVMLAVRKKPEYATLGAAVLSGAALILILRRNSRPGGQMLIIAILTGLAGITGAVLWTLMKFGHLRSILGTSLAGAVAHNVGQVLVASAVLHLPRLMTTYLPPLIGAGAAVGILTGLVTERVLAALRIHPETGKGGGKDEE